MRVIAEEFLALLKALRMGIDGFNALQRRTLAAQQILLDFYALLTHNMAVCLAQ